MDQRGRRRTHSNDLAVQHLMGAREAEQRARANVTYLRAVAAAASGF